MHLWIAYFPSNMSAKNYQKWFMYIKVVARWRWDVYFGTQSIYYINGTRLSVSQWVTEVGAFYGRLSCGRQRGLCLATHATVGSGHGWLGVVLARQADLSGRLGATNRCASTSWCVSTAGHWLGTF